MPGQWSNWSNWSECSATCGRGIRKRTRICNNPAPINNGPGCEGLAVEKKSCNQVCPAVDGKWTSWSSWSSCSSDCQQFRRRLCNNPKPSNGGRYCLGDDIAKQNCTGGMCKRKLHIQIPISTGIYSNFVKASVFLCKCVKNETYFCQNLIALF